MNKQFTPITYKINFQHVKFCNGLQNPTTEDAINKFQKEPKRHGIDQSTIKNSEEKNV